MKTETELNRSVFNFLTTGGVSSVRFFGISFGFGEPYSRVKINKKLSLRSSKNEKKKRSKSSSSCACDCEIVIQRASSYACGCEATPGANVVFNDLLFFEIIFIELSLSLSVVVCS